MTSIDQEVRKLRTVLRFLHDSGIWIRARGGRVELTFDGGNCYLFGDGQSLPDVRMSCQRLEECHYFDELTNPESSTKGE